MKIASSQQSGDVAYNKLYTLLQLPKTATAKASRQSTLSARRRILAMINYKCQLGKTPDDLIVMYDIMNADEGYEALGSGKGRWRNKLGVVLTGAGVRERSSRKYFLAQTCLYHIIVAM